MDKMESEVMCESGSWKNFEDLEEELTLDELYLLYETTTERQTRMLKTIAAAMGAHVDDTPTGDDATIQYQAGQEIAAGGSVLFGYRTKEPLGEQN